jgi:hypothetical protein
MTRVINFVESHVGNAGNSLFTCFLVEFFVKYNLNYILVDLDALNPDVATRYESLGSCNRSIELQPKENRDAVSLDSLIDLVFESKTQAIVNIPARSLAYVEKFIDGYEFSDVRLRRWFISDLDRKSWNLFEKMVDYDEEKYDVILVHNMIAGIEMTQSQKDFCESHCVEIIKMSWLQLPDVSLEAVLSNPSIPLGSLIPSLNEMSQKRFSVALDRMFQWISPIIVGR